MKITDLIAELTALHTAHGDLEVAVAADAEGNAFSDLAEATWQHYDSDDRQIASPCEAGCGTCEDCEDLEGTTRVAMLWPL